MQALASCGLVFLLVSGLAGRGLASEGFEDLVKLVKTGMSEATLLGYVQCSPVNYALTPDEVIYLSDLGLSTEIIKAINAHGPAPDSSLAELAEDDLASDNDSVMTGDETGEVAEVAADLPVAPEPAPVAAVPVEDGVQEVVSQAPVVVAPAAGMADMTLFYDQLAPYGTWVIMEGTWCWQPSAMVINPAWQPYCHRGHWVFTDHGWVWSSLYSWGWAPFHYGRWRRHDRYGWLWYPGTVWGPAWVCWRYSDTAVGWAPLPPEAVFDPVVGLSFQGHGVGRDFDFNLGYTWYTFVPFGHLFHPRLDRHCYRRREMPGVFRRADRIESRHWTDDRRPYNAGPPPAKVAQATRRELRPRTLVDSKAVPGEPIRRTPATATSLPVYRPVVAPTATATPPQVVHRRQTASELRRETVRRGGMTGPYPDGRVVQDQAGRGRQSGGAAGVSRKPSVAPPVITPPATRPPVTTPPPVARPPVTAPPVARPPASQPQDSPRDIRDRQRDEADARQQVQDQAQRQAQERARLLQEQARQRQAEETVRKLQESRRQRLQEEAAERQRESRRRQADQLIQQQNEARRQAQERARQQALEQARLQEQARQRQVEAAATSQALARQQLEAARAAETARRRADTERALREPRLAEEASARRAREQATRQPPPVQPTSQVAPPAGMVPGYGNGAATGVMSQRGKESRDRKKQGGNH